MKPSLLEDDMPIYIEHARKSSDQLIKLTGIQKKYWVKH